MAEPARSSLPQIEPADESVAEGGPVATKAYFRSEGMEAAAEAAFSSAEHRESNGIL